MATGSVTLPAGYSLESGQSPTPSAPPSGSSLPPGYSLELPVSASSSSQPENDPSKSGYTINDVGNKVIVPMDGESFADTMKRAAAQGQKTTPEEIGRENASIPGKLPYALAAPVIAGAGGAALLAGPGDAAAAMEAGGEGVLPSVFAHTANGVRAITAWASKNPVQAYLLFQVMKELVPGTKKLLGIAKDAPDAPQ